MKKKMLCILALAVSGVSFAADNTDVLLASSPTSGGHTVTKMEPLKVDPALLNPPTKPEVVQKQTKPPTANNKAKKPVSNWLDK